MSSSGLELLLYSEQPYLQIIVGIKPHAEACCMLGIQSLADRRSELCGTPLKQIVNNEFHSLHHMLPAKHDTQLISRLRSTTVYPTLIDLKFCSYLTACRTTSDSCDILFHFIAYCVHVRMSVFVLLY